MKRLIISFVMMVVFVTFNQLQAQEFHSRLLVRGAKLFKSTNFGVVGWFVAPDIVNATNKRLHIFGPYFKTNNWDLEVMAGAFVESTESTALIDIRSGFGEALFGNTGVSMWSNIEWIDPLGKAEKFYLYHQISYSLIDGILSPFIETENVFKFNQPDDLSVGVGLVAHVGQRMNMVIVHQWYNKGLNQVWFRTIFNL